MNSHQRRIMGRFLRKFENFRDVKVELLKYNFLDRFLYLLYPNRHKPKVRVNFKYRGTTRIDTYK